MSAPVPPPDAGPHGTGIGADRVRALFSGVSSGYDTHRPVLCEAVLRTRGPILELGTGEGSTLALHAVATESLRPVFSFDADPRWIRPFLTLRNEHHRLALVASWDECPIESQFWAVAFVDHAPAERRAVELARLAYRAELVVVHDTEDPRYGCDRVLESFAYRFDHREYKQWTTVVSNYLALDDWRIEA